MRTRRTPAILIGCLAACLAVAACGSSTSSSTSSGSAASGSATAAASVGTSGFAARRSQLVVCLKQHGVTLPSRPFHGGHFTPGSGNPGSGRPRFRGGGFFGGGFFRANPKLQAAFKACGANFPRRRFDFTSGAGRVMVNKFVTCVRQHGYNLPAPNFSGKGPVFPAGIRTNPKFRSASRMCANLLVPRGAPPQGQPPQSSQSSA